jgi:photosystem II stability/assembly factor-like uncharacterized protein
VVAALRAQPQLHPDALTLAAGTGLLICTVAALALVRAQTPSAAPAAITRTDPRTITRSTIENGEQRSVVQTRGLTSDLGDLQAVDDIDLDVPRGRAEKLTENSRTSGKQWGHRETPGSSAGR